MSTSETIWNVVSAALGKKTKTKTTTKTTKKKKKEEKKKKKSERGNTNQFYANGHCLTRTSDSSFIDANGEVVYTKTFNDKTHLWCGHCRRWTSSHYTGSHVYEATRESRSLQHRSFKVQHDRSHQAIVGGDWIMSATEEPMTLAFAFNGGTNTEYAGKVYGVTCAHICPTIQPENSPIYLLTSDRVNARGRYTTKMIGNVVSVDKRFDSLIFEFLPNINVEANKIRLSSKTIHTVDFSDESTLKEIINGVNNIIVDTELIGFGSQRRGFTGMVQGIASKIIPCWDPTRHETINGEDIGIDSFDPRNVEAKGSKMITYDGDCGMISFNKRGVPLVMHKALSTYKKDNEPYQYRSWGVPLTCVFRAHGRYFGFYDSSKEIEQRCGLPVLSPKPWNVVQPARYEFEFLPGEEPKRVNCYPFVKAPSNGIKVDFEYLPGEEPNEVD